MPNADEASTPIVGEPDPGHPDQPYTSRGPLSKALRGLGYAAVLATFGLWIFGFTGLGRADIPDLLVERAWANNAIVVCESARAEIRELPLPQTFTSAEDRIAQLEASGEILTDMVDQLEASAAGTPEDLVIIEGFVADWRQHLADRADWAERLATDPDARFFVADTGSREQHTRRIFRVADFNGILACDTLGDVGSG